MSRLLAVIRKEFRHVGRDPYALAGATVGTVLLMALLSYAISADITQIPIVVVDGDRSAASRAYVQRFEADVFFDVRGRVAGVAEARRAVEAGQVRGAVILPAGFAGRLLEGQTASVQLIVDGTDPTIARQIQSNAEALSQGVVAGGSSAGPAFGFRIQPLYNATLKELNTILPGLMAFVLIFPPLFAILSLVREKERGSMEQLMTTPIRRYQLLIGKMTPYLLIGLLDVLLLTLIGVFFFGVPFRGRVLDLLLLSALFLFANLGISMLLSSLLSNQMAALIVGSLLFIFPISQSGLTAPLFAMPPDAQRRALLWPATHYIIITRGVFLKGLGVRDLAVHALSLLATGLLLNGLTLWRLEKRIA